MTSAEPIKVWGLGYIGLTTTEALLNTGRRVVGIEPSVSRQEDLRRGTVILNLATGYTVDVSAALKRGELELHSSGASGGDAHTHIICVPTEHNGVASRRIVDQVLHHIMQESGRPTVIVESTLAPVWVSDINPRYPIVVAPRRDWFHNPQHRLETLTRVVGCADAEQLERASALLSTISRSIVTSEDPIAVAASKAFENSIWFVLFSYIDEIAARTVDIDVLEMLRLSQTNWRTPFELSVQTKVGGYCLPLSADYLQQSLGLAGAKILRAAQEANIETADIVADTIHLALDAGSSVLVLGITYRPHLRVTTNSTGKHLVERLCAYGLRVLVHDPQYTPEEIRSELQVDYLDPRVSLLGVDCIVNTIDLAEYASPDFQFILENSPVRLYVDASGSPHAPPRVVPSGCKYVRLGDRSWMNLRP